MTGEQAIPILEYYSRPSLAVRAVSIYRSHSDIGDPPPTQHDVESLSLSASQQLSAYMHMHMLHVRLWGGCLDLYHNT